MTAPASPPVAGVELRLVIDWLEQLARADDLDDIAADGGVTVAMVYQQEAAMQARRLRALASPVSGDGSLQAEDRPSVPSQREVRLVLAARAVAFGDHFSPSSIKELDAASEAYAADVPWEDEPKANDPCGGCGESNPVNRCIGCMHVFSPPPAASVSPGMETLQASECTKPNGNGEGEQ